MMNTFCTYSIIWSVFALMTLPMCLASTNGIGRFSYSGFDSEDILVPGSGCSVCVGLPEMKYIQFYIFPNPLDRYPECTTYQPILEAVETLIQMVHTTPEEDHKWITLWVHKPDIPFEAIDELFPGFEFRINWLNNMGMLQINKVWRYRCLNDFSDLFHDRILTEIAQRKLRTHHLASGYIRKEAKTLNAESQQNSGTAEERYSGSLVEESSECESEYIRNYDFPADVTDIVGKYLGVPNYTNDNVSLGNICKHLLIWFSELRRFCVTND
eukprot:77416_1